MPILRKTQEEKEYHREYQKAWRKHNPEKVRTIRKASALRRKRHTKNRRIQKAFGITIEQYEALFVAQGGKCDICERSIEMKHASIVGAKNAAVLDHCHETGRIRAFLCSVCNSGIGAFKDHPLTMMVAASYLLRHGKAVPEDLD